MQGGGPAIQLEQYEPGQYIEKALGDTIEYAKFYKEFEEEQRQFNVESTEDKRQFNETAGIERERNRIASEGIRTDEKIAFQGMKDKAIDRKRADWDKHSTGLSWTAQIALAGDDPDLASKKSYAQEEKILYDEAMRQWNSAKTGNNPIAMKVVMDEHRGTIERSSGGTDKLTSWQTEIEGASAKSALQNLAGNEKFMSKLTEMGMNTSIFSRADLTNSEALFWLQQIPARIEQNLAERRVSATEKSTLATAFGPVITALNDQVEAAYESGSAGQLIKLQSDFTKLYDKYLSDLDIGYKREDTRTEEERLADALKEKEKARLKEVTRYITVGKEGEEKKLTAIDKTKDYRIKYKTPDGREKAVSLPGSRIKEMEEREGIEIFSREEIVKPYAKGSINIKVGDVITDTKTNKTLTYVGAVAPLAGAAAMSVAPQLLPLKKLFKAKFMIFKDSEGNKLHYPVFDMWRHKFTKPNAMQQTPEEVPVVAEEEIGGGMLRGVQAEQMGGAEIDAALADSSNKILDLFMQEKEQEAMTKAMSPENE